MPATQEHSYHPAFHVQVRQWIGWFCNMVFSGSATLGRMPLSPFCCQVWSILFAMEPWSGVQHAFAVKAFYKNGDSFVFAQREFWRFGIHPNSHVHVVHEWLEFCRGRSEDLCVKYVERWLQTARVTQWRRAEWCGLLSVASLTTAIFLGVCTVFLHYHLSSLV